MQTYLTRPSTPCKQKSPPPDDGLDRILGDPNLCGTAKAVAVALVRHWAWGHKDHCWPSDKTIAAKVGRSPGHVQRCLRQLERLGHVTRERTDEVPNGRRIWLLWRHDPRAGAQPTPAPARTGPPAPARSKAIVIVNEGRESGIEKGVGRPREGVDPPLTRRCLDAHPPAESGRNPGGPGVDPVGPPASPPPSPPRPPQAPPRGVRRVGLSLAELATAATVTADPILARELARLTAPPPPVEAPPSSLTTTELLALLPGRHDLVMAAARRLCVEVGDQKAATYRACEGMARSVACRAVAPSVLVDCVRQATGPLARHKGKVLVASWKRGVSGR